MGLIHFGVPPQLVQAARERFSIRAFVETGTFEGDTAAFAANLFERVYTIELLGDRCEKARRRLAGEANVTVLSGDSPEMLRQILPGLRGVPTMFWLDAHWDGDGPIQGPQCPLTAELRAINDGGGPGNGIVAYILVDDARYFMAPPPPPRDPGQWPALSDIIPLLSDNGRRYVVIVDDIIVAFPVAARPFLEGHARGRPHAWAPPAVSGGVFFVPKSELPPRTIVR